MTFSASNLRLNALMQAIRKWAFVAVLVSLVPLCVAQLAPPPAPVPPPSPSWTDWSGPGGSSRIRARIREDPPLSSHSIAVEVNVENIFLTDSAPMNVPSVDRGMLRYRLDQCPPVAAAATDLRFDQLQSGEHTITVTAIAPDNRPLTPEVTLHAKIP